MSARNMDQGRPEELGLIEEARERLADLANFLINHYSRPFASNAIQSYLNGTQPSLDHAFDLVRP